MTVVDDMLIEVPRDDASLEGPFTVEEMMQLPETDQYQLELHEGAIRIVPPPDPEHNAAQLDLVMYFRSRGRKVYTEVGIKFNDLSYRIPEVAVLRPGATVAAGVLQPPAIFDVLVEIVSPSSVDEDGLVKAKLYAKAGIPEYWRVENTISGRIVVRSRLRGGRYVQVGAVALEELLAGGGGLG